MSNRFRRGSGSYKCNSCGRQTRATGGNDNEHIGLCAECYDMAGIENDIADNGETPELLAELARAKSAVIAKGGKLTPSNPGAQPAPQGETQMEITQAQEARIQQIMNDKGVTHVAALRQLTIEESTAKRGSNSKPAPKAKAPKDAKPKAERKPKAGGYDRELVLKLWKGGMRPSEIAKDGRAGIKGISSVYVSRIIVGTTFGNGQTPEQKERAKEEARRRKGRSAERKAEAKDAK